MIVSYDIYTDELSVLYYGWGVRFFNLEVALNGLTKKGVFISRSVNRAYETSVNIVRAAIAVYSPLSTIVNAFENLQPYINQDVNKTIFFDPTYET